MGTLMILSFTRWTNVVCVPIQRDPSFAASKFQIRESGSFCPSGGSQGVNRTPSNRIRPFAVPSQMYPSAVCAMEVGFDAKTPSCMRHAVCPY